MTARTSCKPEAKWSSVTAHPEVLPMVERLPEHRLADRVDIKAAATGPGPRRNEPVSSIYSSSGSDLAVDGRGTAGRSCGLYPVTGLGPAPGSLSEHPGDNFL